MVLLEREGSWEGLVETSASIGWCFTVDEGGEYLFRLSEAVVLFKLAAFAPVQASWQPKLPKGIDASILVLGMERVEG